MRRWTKRLRTMLERAVGSEETHPDLDLNVCQVEDGHDRESVGAEAGEGEDTQGDKDLEQGAMSQTMKIQMRVFLWLTSSAYLE